MIARSRYRNLLPVIAFVVVTGTLCAYVALTLGRVRFQETSDYSALFSDASGLNTGVDVRIAGVRVGRVSDIKLSGGEAVAVAFDVDSNIPLTQGTRATIKYANLTGDRFLELSRDTAGAARLAPGATIPLANTKPALDLDQLFQGFQPLVTGLEPGELNRLAKSIIAVANGQGSAVETLLRNVASLTTALADKDELIGSVIENLNRVLGTLVSRDDELNELITGLDRLVGGLADDRKVIGESLGRVDRLATATTRLTQDLRPGLRDTLSQAQRTSDLILADVDNFNRQLDSFPEALTLLSRAGAYGSFFNFYLCAVRFKFSDEGAATPIYTPYQLSTEPRCQKK